MPYIKPADRKSFNLALDNEGERFITNAGELQYVIALLVKDFLGSNYRYQDLNDVMGALAGAQMEFYRRVVAPYEDTKIKENGDVY